MTKCPYCGEEGYMNDVELKLSSPAFHYISSGSPETPGMWVGYKLIPVPGTSLWRCSSCGVYSQQEEREEWDNDELDEDDY